MNLASRSCETLCATFCSFLWLVKTQYIYNGHLYMLLVMRACVLESKYTVCVETLFALKPQLYRHHSTVSCSNSSPPQSQTLSIIRRKTTGASHQMPQEYHMEQEDSPQAVQPTQSQFADCSYRLGRPPLMGNWQITEETAEVQTEKSDKQLQSDVTDKDHLYSNVVISDRTEKYYYFYHCITTIICLTHTMIRGCFYHIRR